MSANNYTTLLLQEREHFLFFPKDIYEFDCAKKYRLNWSEFAEKTHAAGAAGVAEGAGAIGTAGAAGAAGAAGGAGGAAGSFPFLPRPPELYTLGETGNRHCAVLWSGKTFAQRECARI